MKNTKKVLLGGVAGLALVGTSVFGTYMYLTANDKVTNSFTVGSVGITLNESKVDEYGSKTSPEEFVKANTYKLFPDGSYTKNPTVHVTKGSYKSYIYVTVQNDIADLEEKDNTDEDYNPIANQITENKWHEIGNATTESGKTVTLYAYETTVTPNANTDTDLKVFEEFTLDDDITNISTRGNDKIIVNAYAVQADGFNDEIDAWNAAFANTVNITAN